jgi:hypothetical protein
MNTIEPLQRLLAIAETHCQSSPYVRGYKDGLKAAIDLARITQVRIDLELANKHFAEGTQQVYDKTS